MASRSYLYFHSPCFDGIASAVLAADFLETRLRWKNTVLYPVDYKSRATWLAHSLPTRSAVVDFLYHPGVQFWADHHPTAFATDKMKRDFQERKDQNLIFDQSADSCAGLLWRYLFEAFGYRRSRYAELVEWADKIDAARYPSVQEAIFPSTAALRISASLALGDSAGYSVSLARRLRTETLDRVAKDPDVAKRFRASEALFRRGLKRFGKAASLEHGGIVVFDVDSRGARVSRYAPYYFFPEARYSIGVVRLDNGAKITAMRNPWRDFPSVPLGKIFQRIGGGGHQRVGSVFLTEEKAKKADRLVKRLLANLRQEESPGREVGTS